MNAALESSVDFGAEDNARLAAVCGPLDENLHLIERFKVDRDGLQYEVTVDDPHTWTKPWTAALTLAHQPDDSLFEYGCHEGNNSMRNILSAARAAERK